MDRAKEEQWDRLVAIFRELFAEGEPSDFHVAAILACDQIASQRTVRPFIMAR
ncbi:MAG TPA: hypothetical protein GX513_03090 [Firmicutes bacterium]|nr:hypothetical protein [Bacillota bacterium]